jgi:serine/threonine protein kinase/class 3 adenylate cyclase
MKALAGYPIVEVLPGGVEGARYRAQEPGSGQLLTLHVLRSGPLTPERRRTIERRAQVLSAIQTPGLEPVVDHRLGAQRPYVAVAQRSVQSLAEWLSKKPERRAAGRVGAALLQVIDRVHAQGLAHGNLAPETVGLDEHQDPWLDCTALETAPTYGTFGASRATVEGDLQALGRLLLQLLGLGVTDPLWRLGGPAPVQTAFSNLLALDPYERPTAAELSQILGPWLSAGAPVEADQAAIGRLESTGGVDPTVRLGPAVPPAPTFRPGVPRLTPGMTLGRYRLEAEIGQGSMGDVYRAHELGTGRAVALKVINPSFVDDEKVLRRFRREARLLADVRHENVVELYEVNEDQGRLYLALELVVGPTLLEYKKDKDRLPERQALMIVAEVAKGLATAHARGIVHRDLKPGNVLLSPRTPSGPGQLPFQVRLCDFGIAKRTVQNDVGTKTDLTDGGAVGTPKYMAPEQCTIGASVTPATDVYALGVVLFDLLSGVAPFSAETTAAVMYAHVHQPAPSLSTVAPGLSAGVVDLVAAALAKDPAQRPADATALLSRIEALLGAPPTFEHPGLPAHADLSQVMTLSRRYDLPAPPEQLWPKVANTERLNRAIGLPAVNWSFEPVPEGGSRVRGEAKQVGLTLRWQERPFEWIEGQRLGVVREYESGPLHWYVSAVELVPSPGGRTVLTHRLWLQPRNFLGRAAVFLETRQRLARRLDAVYQRIGAVVAGAMGDPSLTDPFEEEAYNPRQGRMLELGAKLDVPVEVKAAFVDWLGRAPEPEVARIRPLALARRLNLPERQVVKMCLEGAACGLLVPLWDVICPTCRIPSTVVESLQAIAAHAHCEACNLGYEVDLSRSVELIFRPHADVRRTEVRTYCVGGPAHSPHAVLQLRLQAKERYTAHLSLEPGPYELRVVGAPWRARLLVEPVGPDRLDVELGPEAPGPLRPVGAGLVTLSLSSLIEGEQVVRLERSRGRDDAFTAADASAHPLFRRLFPEQTFKAETLVGLESITLLITDLADPDRLYRELGDAKMLGELHLLLSGLSAQVEEAGGALVKTAGHGIVAAFTSTEDAVRAGLAILGRASAPGLPLIAAIHRGRAMAATVNDRLDYFGRSVNRTHRLLGLAAPGQLVLSDEVAEDPRVERVWRAAGLETEVLTLAGNELEFALRLGTPRKSEARAD